MGLPRSDTGYEFESIPISNVGATPATVPGLGVMDGVLRILNSNRVPDGDGGLTLTCQSSGNFRHRNWEIFSTNLVPPTLDEPTLTIREFEDGLITCLNDNAVLLQAVEVWLNPRGVPAVERDFTALRFTNISRNQAGEYVCRLTANTGRTATVTATVVVEYPPEASTTEIVSRNISLGGSMTLRCDFGGVPTPSVVWIQNSTVQLNSSDSRISIATDGSSILTFTALGRDDGGLYTCRFENTVGVLDVNVTTVLVLIPPAAVTELRAPTIEETRIIVTWMKGFDGFTPITGAMIQYSAEGGGTLNRTVDSMDPTTVTLSGLMPFTNYTISVSLFNMVGTGDSTSILVQTRSLRLAAPLNVMITVLNSTALQVNWNPPAPSMDTDPSDSWFVNITLPDGTPIDNATTPDAQTTTVTFSSLSKGTQYSVRVRGENEVEPGEVEPGAFSQPVTMETSVDPPSAPLNVRVTGATSFALTVMWDQPEDNGGREILEYIITLEGSTTIVPASVETFLIREDFLVNSTTYSVSVTARNSNTPPLTGPTAMGSGTTLSLDEPQAILDEPVTDSEMNTSVVISWEEAPGEVDLYLITYTQNVPPNLSMNTTVDGDVTSITLTDLEPMTSYTVMVFSMNSNGLSLASPSAMFVTTKPDPPIVTIDQTGRIFVGTTVVLTCVTADTYKPIMWYYRDTLLMGPVFVQRGVIGRSTLTITNIQMNQSGVYECQVREEMDDINVMVEIRNGPTISNTVIIAVSAGGGGGLILLLCLIGILIFCFCCRRKEKDNKYITNRAMKPDKRTKELFEVSTSAGYAPVRDPVAGDETGISFNIPEDYQTHSSFNTMDKVDKPKPQHRSASPEPVNTSSFGVGAPTSSENLTAGSSSPPRYQDMPPPPNYDGTLL